MGLAEVFERVAGHDAGVEFVAFDGSRAGSPGSPGVTVTVRNPVAVSYLAQAPGALGLARAFVSGHLDVDGDMYTALARLATAQRIDLSWAERLSILNSLGGPKLLLRRAASPPQAVRVNRRWRSGRPHSRSRDASPIAHPHDACHLFYEWSLAPSLASPVPCYPG